MANMQPGLPYPQMQQKPAKGAPQVPELNVAAELSNLSRRMRILEERYNNLNKRTQVSEQNMLSSNKELQKSIKANESEILDLKRDLEDLRDKMRLIVLELKECAKQDQMEILRKYVDMWELVNFATRAEVEKMIDEKLEGLRQKI